MAVILAQYRTAIRLIGLGLVLLLALYWALLLSGLLRPVEPGDSAAIIQQLLNYASAIVLFVILASFALAGYAASRGTVDVDRLVNDLVSARSEATSSSRERDLLREEVQALRKAVTSLASQRGQPGVAAALSELARGEPAKAEAIFTQILESKTREGTAALSEAAEVARHLGALAYLHDTRKALSAYQRATELDPADISGWILLGLLYKRSGDLAAAERALVNARQVAEQSDDQRAVGISLAYLGDIWAARGDRADALNAYSQSLDIQNAYVLRDPNNAEWQRDLSVSYDRIGDVRVAQGDRAGALEAYEQGRAIAEKLAGRDPNNAEWQRDLSVSLNKIGDVRVAQGDRAGALEAYEQGRAIREKLAGRDPNNAEWQRDLIVSCVKLAEAASSAGESRGRYEAALVIARQLHASGRLAPVDHWMIEELEMRLSKPVSTG